VAISTIPLKFSIVIISIRMTFPSAIESEDQLVLLHSCRSHADTVELGDQINVVSIANGRESFPVKTVGALEVPSVLM